MSRPGRRSAAERLLALLPALFRTSDHEQAVRIAATEGFQPPDPLADIPEGPLFTLLTALGQQLDLLEAEVDWLYEDQFVETCADWVVPYIGALVGARIVDTGDSISARLQVANAIRDRRGKGTARALASRAAAVMAAPAEAIEYTDHVAATFNLNFPGAKAAMTTAINGKPGRTLRLPGTVGRLVTELRDMREGGRFAPPNVGARVWLTRSVQHSEVVPFAVAGGEPGRFRFNPLGRDIALWSKPEPRNVDHPRLAVNELPVAIPLTAAVDEPGLYYGTEKSILIAVDGLIKPLDEVCFCDLGDVGDEDHWNSRGAFDAPKIRIDPTRGRFVLPAGGAGVAPDALRVLYHFGTELIAGGAERRADAITSDAELRSLLGARDRRPNVPPGFSLDSQPPPALIPSASAPSEASALLLEALNQLGAAPAVLVEFGGTTLVPTTTTLPVEGNFELRGGEGVWPTLRMSSAWRIENGAGATLALRGLRIFGEDILILAQGLNQLTLIDCTVVAGSAAIRIEEPACKLLAVRSTLGRLRVAPPVEVMLVDCLVDSAAADSAAIAGLDDAHGGVLWAERCTVIGDVRLRAFDEVSNCLFAKRSTRSLATPVVSAEELQHGCVRYSAVPRGSVVPRRYRCFPDEDDTSSPEAMFASLEYANAEYATLLGSNAKPLLTGAEDGGEMGIGNRYSYYRRSLLLDHDLEDWVPFGMAASTELRRG